jgi:hypothetical protein
MDEAIGPGIQCRSEEKADAVDLGRKDILLAIQGQSGSSVHDDSRLSGHRPRYGIRVPDIASHKIYSVAHIGIREVGDVHDGDLADALCQEVAHEIDAQETRPSRN